METPRELSRLRLLFTTTYAAQCLAWISFIAYLTVIGPPALAVMLAFPVEMSGLTNYFLQLSMFLTQNTWVTNGLIFWTGLTGAILLPRQLRLFSAHGFEGSTHRFMAYSTILSNSFSLCLALLLMIVGTEALMAPIDHILERGFGSRLEFLEIVIAHFFRAG